MAGTSVIVEMSEPIQGGGIDPAALDALTDCLRNDRLDTWAAEVRAAIADSRGSTSPAAIPRIDPKVERARRISDEIRKLQTQLRELEAA